MIDPSPHFQISGGKPLVGEIIAQCAKNALGKQLVASLLTKDTCTFTNVPNLTELRAIADMLSDVGAIVDWRERTLTICAGNLTTGVVSERYSGFNRIPILMIGPLLHRFGEVVVPFVGGCKIGPRPVDFHIAALEKMGASFELGNSTYTARASGLRGTVI